MAVSKWVKILVGVLIIEKITQHILTMLFFIIDIEGIGKPDIGSTFDLSDSTMAFLNLLYAILFLIALIPIKREYQKAKIGLNVAIFISIVDIVSEFLFHGFGFITVSVIMCILLIAVFHCAVVPYDVLFCLSAP